jgi:hypothetical protein
MSSLFSSWLLVIFILLLVFFWTPSRVALCIEDAAPWHRDDVRGQPLGKIPALFYVYIILLYSHGLTFTFLTTMLLICYCLPTALSQIVGSSYFL